eukprot:5124895-Pyramimonas_sp.AAC.1
MLRASPIPGCRRGGAGEGTVDQHSHPEAQTTNRQHMSRFAEGDDSNASECTGRERERRAACWTGPLGEHP